MENKPYIETTPPAREVWTPTKAHDVAPYQAAIARIAELEAMVVEVRKIAYAADTNPHRTIGEHLLAKAILDATSNIVVADFE